VEILFLHVFRAIWALRRDPGFVSLGVLAVTAILGGTAFYAVVEDLAPLDAAYLSVASLTTVGFGDITPAKDPARVMVAIQMLLDLVFIGVGIRMLFNVAQHGLLETAEEVDAETT